MTDTSALLARLPDMFEKSAMSAGLVEILAVILEKSPQLSAAVLLTVAMLDMFSTLLLLVRLTPDRPAGMEKFPQELDVTSVEALPPGEEMWRTCFKKLIVNHHKQME